MGILIWGAAMKHLCLPCLLLLVALTSAQVSFGNGQEQRPRPRSPLSRPPPGGRPPLQGRPPRPFQPGGGRPPRPVGLPNRPRPQRPFQGQQGQGPFQGQGGQRPNLGQPGSGNRPENQNPTTGTATSVTVRQRWSQEPQGFDREATLKLPQVLPADGKKLPLVVDLHGNGGQGNVRRLSFLGDSVAVVAPNGYQRSWNVYNEKSKADDVSFILDLIKKVVEENPVVDRNDVTIMGTSNGAAMIYRLLLETGRDRPFHRVIPIASSLISVQHHDNQFWKSESGSATDHSMPVQPQFDDDFQFLHFHGTDDGTIAYWRKSPGPSFLGANVDVLSTQRTDFLFARAMGYPGSQKADNAGQVIGGLQVYSYLGGRVKHFKHIGGTHGNTLGNAQTKEEVKKAITGGV